MNISRFDKATAPSAHNGTILGGSVLPKGMKAPFSHAWGYLENGKTMEGHAHPTAEVYMVFAGSGFVVIGEERQHVTCGDVIEVPANVYHTMVCDENATFLWAALWWKE